VAVAPAAAVTAAGIIDVYVHPVDKGDQILAVLARIENQQRQQGRLLQELLNGVVAVTQPDPNQPNPVDDGDDQVPAEPTPAQ
jgi:hypothetical protein